MWVALRIPESRSGCACFRNVFGWCSNKKKRDVESTFFPLTLNSISYPFTSQFVLREEGNCAEFTARYPVWGSPFAIITQLLHISFFPGSLLKRLCNKSEFYAIIEFSTIKLISFRFTQSCQSKGWILWFSTTFFYVSLNFSVISVKIATPFENKNETNRRKKLRFSIFRCASLVSWDARFEVHKLTSLCHHEWLRWSQWFLLWFLDRLEAMIGKRIIDQPFNYFAGSISTSDIEHKSTLMLTSVSFHINRFSHAHEVLRTNDWSYPSTSTTNPFYSSKEFNTKTS